MVPKYLCLLALFSCTTVDSEPIKLLELTIGDLLNTMLSVGEGGDLLDFSLGVGGSGTNSGGMEEEETEEDESDEEDSEEEGSDEEESEEEDSEEEEEDSEEEEEDSEEEEEEESDEEESEGGSDNLLTIDLSVLSDLLNIDIGVSGLGGGGGGGEEEGGDSGGESEEECEEDEGECYSVETIDRSVNDEYCDQPLFVTFLTKTESHCLVDNVCYTYFPLPDDPYTFNLYRSTVFCDGSSRVETAIVTELDIGRSRVADPFCTFSSNVIGYAGCDTFVLYRCMEFGECSESEDIGIIGLSPSCLPLGLSCIQKVQEIVEFAGLPETEFVILPQKLPNRCVTEQICVNNIKGNFFRALNLPAPAPPALLL